MPNVWNCGSANHGPDDVACEDCGGPWCETCGGEGGWIEEHGIVTCYGCGGSGYRYDVRRQT